MSDPSSLHVRAEQREALAKLAHEQWTGWMRHLFSKCEAVEGGLLIPVEWAARWTRQMTTSYAALSDAEQNSDREEADRVLDLLAALVLREGEQTTERRRELGTRT